MFQILFIKGPTATKYYYLENRVYEDIESAFYDALATIDCESVRIEGDRQTEAAFVFDYDEPYPIRVYVGKVDPIHIPPETALERVRGDEKKIRMLYRIGDYKSLTEWRGYFRDVKRVVSSKLGRPLTRSEYSRMLQTWGGMMAAEGPPSVKWLCRVVVKDITERTNDKEKN